MPRVRPSLICVLVLILVSTTACSNWTLDWQGDSLGDVIGGASESASIVEHDGFIVDLKGVAVSSSSGIAPIGTSVRARLVEHGLTADVQAFADPIGSGVEIVLGDGIQPTSPLTITFAANAFSEWRSVEAANEDLFPVVFASREGGSGVEFADANLLPNGSIVVTAEHLSIFQPALVSISKLGRWFGEQVEIGLELRSNKPDCVGDSNLAPDWSISVVPNLVLWTCVVQHGDDLDIALTNNSPYVWLVSSTQAYPLEPEIPTTSLVGGAVDLLALQFIDLETTRPIIPPDGSVNYSTITYDDEYVFEVALSAPLTVANGTLNILSAVLPFKKIQAIGKAQCLIDAAVTITAEPYESIGERTSTVISCAGSIVKGLGGVVLSALAAGPSAGRAFDGISELNRDGTDEFTITLSKIEVDDEPIVTWPTDRNDGPSTLWVWLGANFAFPSWVACDDAEEYCLVGFDGGPHWLVKIRGLEVIATIEDWADPQEALVYLGLSDEVIDQILGT